MAIDPKLASKIANAKTGGGGNRIKDGEYVLVVKRILCETKFNGTFVIPEMDVVAAEATQEGVVPNKEGTDVSSAWSLDAPGKQGEAALGNIKQFFCALLGLDEGSTSPEAIMEKVGQYAGKAGDPDSTRARGMLVHCVTRRKTIQTGKNAGKDGTFPYFSTVSAEDGNSAAEIAERRKELDAKKR